MSEPADTQPDAGNPSGKVILAFDKEAGGDDVLAFGTALADALGASPEVVSVLSWPPHFLERYSEFRAVLDEALAPGFDRIKERWGAGVKTRTIPGPTPAGALHDLALSEGARAIVAGSARRGPIGRTLAGSVSDSLMYGSPCPVAIVPRGYADEADRPDALRNIAVAFDGSDEADQALLAAVALTERTGGRLTVIGVVDPVRQSYGSGWPAVLYEELEQAERDFIQDQVDEAVAKLPADLGAATLVLRGRPAETLAEASGDYDLLVAGSRAYGPIKRTVLGSTARQLVQSAACPVLVVPRGADESVAATRDQPR